MLRRSCHASRRSRRRPARAAAAASNGSRLAAPRHALSPAHRVPVRSRGDTGDEPSPNAARTRRDQSAAATARRGDGSATRSGPARCERVGQPVPSRCRRLRPDRPPLRHGCSRSPRAALLGLPRRCRPRLRATPADQPADPQALRARAAPARRWRSAPDHMRDPNAAPTGTPAPRCGRYGGSAADMGASTTL